MGITYRQLAWLKDPGKISSASLGEVIGCPKGVGGDIEIYDGCNVASTEKCNACWDREIPYPVIAVALRDTEVCGLHRNIRTAEKYIVVESEYKYSGKIGVKILINGSGKLWVNHKDFKYYIDKGGKKLNKEFTKSDMKDGMLCETADGSRMFWIEGNLRGISEYNPCIKDDLTHLRYPMGDIVKVGYPDFGRYQTIEKAINGDFKEVIWERKENKEISSDEAFRVLKEHYGCDVKIKE
mgnify:CR=1 FL=1